MTESIHSMQGLETSRGPVSHSPLQSVGVITGDAPTHFLVKHNSAWIPISKSSIFSSKGDHLPSLSFKEVKGKRVHLLGIATFRPEAYLMEDGQQEVEPLFGDISEGQTERIRDLESEYCETEGGKDQAIDSQTALAAELLADVAVLTALSNDHSKTQKYMFHRLPRLRKSVDRVFSTMKSTDPDLYATSKQASNHLMANLGLLSTEDYMDCVGCHHAHAKAILACGHGVCVDCGEGLVNFSSGKEVRLHPCPVCLRELSIADARLILLEKYETLKQSGHMVQTISLDASHSNKRR